MARTVHPRVCGEHNCRPNWRPCVRGSSPRMRGILPLSAEQHASTRFIPAYAGNTEPAVTVRRCSPRFIPAYAGNTGKGKTEAGLFPVHPRVCGEHSFAQASQQGENGSSPRMRGTRQADGLQLDDCRFIPAYAGNTLTPRETERLQGGSSPRMRGTQRCQPRPALIGRFIPAYAGNTSACRRHCRVRAVHPRVCGEHRSLGVTKSGRGGSSPRMRGTPITKGRQMGTIRFIPAYAGNTARDPQQPRGSAVHPRVCGEHSRRISPRAASTGSSPRMRGTREPHRARRIPRRFIPAYAGNTRVLEPSVGVGKVHPRVCGEHLISWAARISRIGSSPRMRGTPPSPLHCAPQVRFIPAYAGNTIRWIRPEIDGTVHPRVCGEHPGPGWRRWAV